ncbi:hypothetical protein HCU01_33600 [Halomonas cupida]|uniref:Uncharacterized protein n=1 Tax=Halomonas cupida TaxID=44933 RepID=A0A1M7KG62_9GAMM|nr:hypothetical protein [Halomonas cupida]GEN25411.1 hypothetical protein HCU01_33600 [Halomonas cupida]SHM64329.1 hypothetical protein SAMN05660971_03494 [Halomonas cupida]
MNDNVLLMVFVAVFAGVWWFVSKRLAKMGKGAFLRHFLGGVLGLFSGLVALSLAFGLSGETSVTGQDDKGNQSVDSASSTHQDLSNHYEVISDQVNAPFKRTVEVVLHERVSEDQLEEIGRSIKAMDDEEVERTFIGYRLDSQPSDSAYWGTTHYNPTLNVVILGLTPDEYKALQDFDVAGEYQEIMGSWFIGRGFPHLLVAYKVDGESFIDEVYADLSTSSSSMVESRTDDGNIRLEKPNNEFGEYFVIDSQGNLQFWSKNGNYFTASPKADSEQASS